MERASVNAGPGPIEVTVNHRLTDAAAIAAHGGELKQTLLRDVPGLAQKHAALAQRRGDASAQFEAEVAEAAKKRDHTLSVIHEDQKSVDAESFSAAEELIAKAGEEKAQREREHQERLEREAAEARARADENKASAERTAP